MECKNMSSIVSLRWEIDGTMHATTGGKKSGFMRLVYVEIAKPGGV